MFAWHFAVILVALAWSQGQQAGPRLCLSIEVAEVALILLGVCDGA